MKKGIYLSFIISSISSGYVLSSPPPHLVYRVDTRNYNEIFRNGFHSWGNNYNIVAHINGGTCSNDGSTSGFISTTADFYSARAIANEYLRQGRNAFLYTIRADHTFYSGPASVDYLQQYNPLSPLSIMSVEMARRANEWDAVDEIPPQNIQEVIEYRVDGSQHEHSNTRYLQVDTTGNPNPYTRNLEEILSFYNFPVRLPNGFTTRLSSCFASCLGSSSSSMLKNNRKNECINEPEEVMNFKTLLLSSVLD